jgi:hypothetical protein
MTTDERPPWLEDALERHPPTRGLIAEGNGSTERGDIRLVSSMDADSPARLGLLLVVDGERSATFMLLSNIVENATDLDVILPADITDLPFDLVAEADIVGTSWQWQLSGPLAHVPETIVDAIERLPGLSDSEALSLPRGMPLSGRTDVRWRWKEDEVLELQSLTADCVRTLLDAPAIDMGFLASTGLSRTLVQDMLLAASDLAATGAASLPSSSAEALGLEEESAVDRMVAELGVDAWLGVSELLISSVGNDYDLAPTQTGVVPHRRVNTDHDPLRAVIASAQNTVRLITWNELWDDSSEGVIEMEVHGRTQRVIRELVAA